MAKAINQNDILDVIKSQVDSFGDLIKIIHSKIEKPKLNQETIIKNIEIVKTILNNIIIEFSTIQNLSNKLISLNYSSITQTVKNVCGVFDEISSLKIPVVSWMILFKLRLGVKHIGKFLKALDNIPNVDWKSISSTLNASLIKQSLRSIFEIFSYIEGIKINLFISVKLKLIRFMLKSIVSFVNKSSKNLPDIKTAIGFVGLYVSLRMIHAIIAMVKTIKIGFWFFIHMWRVKKAIKKMVILMKSLTILSKYSNMIKKTTINLTELLISLFLLKQSILIIKSIRLGLFFKRKLNKIAKVITQLSEIIRRMREMGSTKGVARKLFILQTIIARLALLMTTIILTTSILIAFILISPVILLCFWVFIKIITSLSYIIRGILKMRSMKGVARKLFILQTIITSLALLMAAIILTTPILIAFILISPVILLCFWAFMKIITFLVKIISKGITVKTFAALFLLSMVILGFIAITIGLFIIMQLAIPLIKGIPMLLLFFVGLAVIVALIVGIGFLASKIPFNSILGLMMVVVILTLMLIIAGEVFLISLMASSIVENAGDIFISLAIIAGVAAAAVGLGFLGMSIAPIIGLAMVGLGMIMLTVGMIFVLALMLLVIQSLSLDPDIVKEKVRTVIETAKSVITTLFQKDEEEDNETDKSWIESVLSFLGEGFIMIMQAILAIAFLALSIVTILLVLFLAAELRLLQEIDLKPELVKKNVATVIETAKSVITTLFQKDEEGDKDSNKDWIRDVIEFLGIDKLKFIVDAIMAIGLLALMVVSVLLLVELAKNLEYIQGINLNDTDVISKTNTIINTANLVVKEMTKPDTTKEHKDEKGILSGILDALIPDDLEKMLDALKVIGRVGMQFACIYLLKTLAENLVTIKEFPDMVGITEKVSTITSTADELIKKILGNEGEKLDFNKSKDRLNTLDRVLTIFKNFSNYTDVGNAEKLTNNYIRFMDKIDTVDLEKLQTTERLFKNMAEFSESISGNFDKLADALNEKIAPLLEKLDKGIQDLNNDVNNNSKKQLQATAESNLADASSDTLKNAAGEDKDKLDKLTTQQKAAQDKDKKKYQGMQDIMDILLGQGGYKGVKITSK